MPAADYRTAAVLVVGLRSREPRPTFDDLERDELVRRVRGLVRVRLAFAVPMRGIATAIGVDERRRRRRHDAGRAQCHRHARRRWRRRRGPAAGRAPVRSRSAPPIRRRWISSWPGGRLECAAPPRKDPAGSRSGPRVTAWMRSRRVRESPPISKLYSRCRRVASSSGDRAPPLAGRSASNTPRARTPDEPSIAWCSAPVAAAVIAPIMARSAPGTHRSSPRS
jgi:hypothetical protein